MGPHGANFYVHGDLLAKCSNVLAVEINGPMLEAETRVIQIKDIDDDLDDESVMRFLEFAYRGDYQVPLPDIEISSDNVGAMPGSIKVKSSGHINSRNLPLVSDLPPQPVAGDLNDTIEKPIPEEDIWGFSKLKKKKKPTASDGWFIEPTPQPESPRPQPSKREHLWSKFCDQAFVQKRQAWEPVPNNDPCEDYSRVFVCHARLYVLSNRYECETLRDLCLQKLRLTLSRYTLHRSRYSDVTKLVRYSYTHTPDFQEGSDKLRNLVCDYVVCHIKQMCCEPEFLNLLQECDGLSRDLMLKLLQLLD